MNTETDQVAVATPQVPTGAASKGPWDIQPAAIPEKAAGVVDPLPPPVAHLGEPGVARGSLPHTRQEIKRLEALAKAQEKAERQAAARAKENREEETAAVAKGKRELLAEAQALAKSCGGQASGTLCPHCSTPEMAVRVKHISLQQRPGEQQRPDVAVGIVVAFYLRKKDDVLTCPRCGYQVQAV